MSDTNKYIFNNTAYKNSGKNTLQKLCSYPIFNKFAYIFTIINIIHQIVIKATYIIIYPIAANIHNIIPPQRIIAAYDNFMSICDF